MLPGRGKLSLKTLPILPDAESPRIHDAGPARVGDVLVPCRLQRLSSFQEVVNRNARISGGTTCPVDRVADVISITKESVIRQLLFDITFCDRCRKKGAAY